MRESLLKIVCCPACGGRLHLDDALEQVDAEIVNGRLQCEYCKQLYPIERQLPRLYVDDDRWASKAREAIGWVELHKKLGIYEQIKDAIDLKIPYYPEEPWLTAARHFDVGLKVANLSGRETILDLGAGRGWAAKYFALKGCNAIALDIVPDEQVGLGRAYALMQQAGVHFEPVIGDSENLPFFADTFDIVFGAAVLHHTSNLRLLLESVYKVLRPGGRLIAISEPCISLSDDPRQVLEKDAADELVFGINESRPTYLDYWAALKNAGFDDVDIFPLDAYSMNETEMEGWAAFLKAIPSLKGVRRIVQPFEAWSDEVQRWRNAWKARGLPRPRTKREALLRAVLLNVSSGVIIVACKGT